MVQAQDDEQDNPRAAGNEVQSKLFYTDYIQTKKRTTAIRANRYLIELLQSEQPLASIEIAEALGMSKVTALGNIKKLMRLDLVCQTKFEQHTLYCLNGLFTHLIDTALLE